MKMGVVMSVEDGRAIIMRAGGRFVAAKAKAGWAKGDIVTIPAREAHRKALLAAAACFLLLLTSFGGYALYFTEVSLISMDINPSIEISLNRMDRVISTSFRNDEGAAILESVDVKGMKYGMAIDTLLSSEALQPYLGQNEYAAFSVYSKTNEAELLAYVNACAKRISESYPRMHTSCMRSDEAILREAHDSGMTPGKYMVFLELQALDSSLEAKNYAHCGIGEMKMQMHEKNGGCESCQTRGGHHFHK